MKLREDHSRSRRRSASLKRKKTLLLRRLQRFFAAVLLLLAIIILGPSAFGRLPNVIQETVQSFLEQTAEDFNIDLTKFASIFPAESDFSDTPISADSVITLPDGSGNLRVDFLDVGQGLSVLVEADGSCLLYDGGDRNASSFVVAYLKERGVETLDYVIASHYDADHINGLVGALYTCGVKQILGPDYMTDTRVYNSLLTRAEELGLGITAPEPGARYPLGQGYFEVLGPLSEDYSDVNNYSLVLRLVYGDTSILLTGDAEAESEQELLTAWPDLKSDVLCVGHHGSPSSTGGEFLDRVQPSYAVISCGRDNSYGHPDASVLERLNLRQIPVWRTDESGTITVTGDGKSLLFSSEKAD